MTRLSSHFISFSQKMFFSVIVLFLAFAACFMLFQYQREKAYKSELLNIQLQSYNDQLYDLSMIIRESILTPCKIMLQPT